MIDISYKKFNEKQVQGYLEHIGFKGEIKNDLETLDKLIYLHQCHIPFENLDICMFDKPFDLSPKGLYKKFVTDKRGGCCFELNGAFVMLLLALGFDAYSCMGRAHISQSGDIGNPYHRANIVTLEGEKYLCDVGYGGKMPSFAVPLSGVHREISNEEFWMTPIGNEWYFLNRIGAKKAGEGSIIINPAFMIQRDFNVFFSSMLQNKNNKFYVERIVNLRRPNGHLSLHNNRLTISSDGKKEVIDFKEEEFDRILREYFGMEI